MLLALSSETGLVEIARMTRLLPSYTLYFGPSSILHTVGSSLKSNLSPISFDSLDNCHCLSLRPSVARRMTSSFV